MSFKTFLRSANNWEEFSSAEKIECETGIETEKEARALCKEFNDNRNESEKAAGTKKEYTEE